MTMIWSFLVIKAELFLQPCQKMVGKVYLSHYEPQKNEKTLLNVLNNRNGQEFDVLSNSKSLLLR